MISLTPQHISATLWRLLDAFVWEPRAMTIEKLGSYKTKAYLIQEGAYQVQTLVADGFMVSMHSSKHAVCYQ